MVVTAVMAAAMAAISVWAIPMPLGAPLTLQVFGAALSGYVLGAPMGCAAVGIYILLGAFGAPVFAGFSGGFAHLAGPTGGFVAGFLAVSLFSGLFSKNKPFSAMAAGIFGLLICHGAGILAYSLLTDSSFVISLLAVSLPYLLKDIGLVMLAYFASRPVLRAAFRG